MQVRKQQLELDMEQQTGSKLGKEYVKAVYYHLAYLTYMQSTSCKMLGWMKHKLESRLLGEISIIRYAHDTTLMAESEEELKSLLVKVKEKSEKAGLKLNIQKLSSWRTVPSCVHAKSLQFHPTLCDPMDYSLLGSSVHEILHARILEWLVMTL